MKTVVVTGLRGMDGAILAALLLDQGYKVYGLIRRSSQGLDLGNAQHLKDHPMLEVVEGDLLDLPSLSSLCRLAKPDLFFNMAAQSHVHTSFGQPVYTMAVIIFGLCEYFIISSICRNSAVPTGTFSIPYLLLPQVLFL